MIGGVDDDTITTNRGEGSGAPDAGDIVIGDNGFVDWALVDRTPSDIDRIWSIDPDTGGTDSIVTGGGDDIVIAGEDGERVFEGGSGAATTQLVEQHLDDGDSVNAGDGRNLVFGDNGRITSAIANAPKFGTQPISLGLVTTIETADRRLRLDHDGQRLRHRARWHRRGHDQRGQRPQRRHR